MIAWLVGIITAILVVLIVWRSVSPEFRARSETPKFRFLENLRNRNNDKNNNPKGGSR